MSQVFVYQSHQVRTVTENNETWFAAKDVCFALGIPWNGNTTLQSISPAWQGVSKLHTPSGKQALIIISEPAVYKLAFRSNKPEADAFTNWVASEVLPAIRKTGTYQAKPKQSALPQSEACPRGVEEAHSLLCNVLVLLDKISAGIREDARYRESGIDSASILWEAVKIVEIADHAAFVARGLLRRQLSSSFEAKIASLQ